MGRRNEKNFFYWEASLEIHIMNAINRDTLLKPYFEPYISRFIMIQEAMCTSLVPFLAPFKTEH